MNNRSSADFENVVREVNFENVVIEVGFVPKDSVEQLMFHALKEMAKAFALAVIVTILMPQMDLQSLPVLVLLLPQL